MSKKRVGRWYRIEKDVVNEQAKVGGKTVKKESKGTIKNRRIERQNFLSIR
jgi:hypothetical protein